jgi:hypothetical protein
MLDKSCPANKIKNLMTFLDIFKITDEKFYMALIRGNSIVQSSFNEETTQNCAIDNNDMHV